MKVFWFILCLLLTFFDYAIGVKLLRAVAEKGHHVTMISPFPLKNPPKTWRDIVLEDLTKGFSFGNILNLVTMSSYRKEIMINAAGSELVQRVVTHPSFKNVINSNETFDLIVLERFMNEALLGLSHRFNAPYIVLSSTGYSRRTNEVVGNPGSTAYTPDLYLHYGYNMTLWQRFHNTFFYCFAMLHKHLVVLPKHRNILKETFPDAPSLEDLFYNTSLILLNAHVSVKYAVPSVPNMIDIGGFHVSPPKPLSEELKKYMDDASDGVIYFSLGSIFLSKDMAPEIRNTILRVFSKLKQKVVWKWEDENSTFSKPPNVRFEKWVSQQDILAHPNLKLFITHGGLLSNIEAIYHGVPLLVIPIFAEQFMNAADIESLGYGLKLYYADITEENFSYLVNELLNNTRYKENIKLRSKILHDQETKPMDRALWWIEYVIRHKGAPHLKSVTLNLKWYQYFLLDVLALAIVIIVFTVAVTVICLKRMFIKRQKPKTD
ncbi:UDP-glucuronosyltransferase 2B2-like isoform X3 [Agrilus planipennis]|uniref:UDP-glucuronosyltransferase n=1 Tax=Agrilus planipennis TaxID=224129 RepID=A0A7F5RBJ0_AGRPL|nr:UDP-glucuronosyltransferase 2B2-like isoform X3 [Agrilus planipennis]